MHKKTSFPLLDRLNGIKKVVLGNHDSPKYVPELLKHVKFVCGIIEYKGYLLSHIPIHPCQLFRFKGNIHGHIHENSLEDERYINVSCEVIDYLPKTLDELLCIY